MLSLSMSMDAAKKTELEKRIVIGLVGVFLLTLLFKPLRHLGSFQSARSSDATTVTEQVNASKPVETLIQPEPEPQREAPRTYTVQELRDPLTSLFPRPAPEPVPASPASPTPEVPPVPPPPTLSVQGIVWGGSTPQAIINDQLYGIHDVVKGAKIIAIDREGVTMDYHGTTLHYSPSSSKSDSF